MSDSSRPVALVTGAGAGIGEACALTLAAQGYAVVVADIDGAAAEAVALRAQEESGVPTLAVAVDISQVDECDRMVAETVARFGRLDGAVNNAGIGTPAAKVADIDLGEWHRTLAVNLNGTMYCMRAELRVMREQGAGAIVNMGSVMSVLGSPQTAAYAASKHAVLGLTRSAALDHAEDGVRVNCVGPGFVRTPLFEAVQDAEAQAFISSQHPRGVVAHPSEIATVVAFLLSDGAINMTGAYIPCDGGYTIR